MPAYFGTRAFFIRRFAAETVGSLYKKSCVGKSKQVSIEERTNAIGDAVSNPHGFGSACSLEVRLPQIL